MTPSNMPSPQPHLAISGERQYHHELADATVFLYHLLHSLREEFPFLALTTQDEEGLMRATALLWELDLLEAEPTDNDSPGVQVEEENR